MIRHSLRSALLVALVSCVAPAAHATERWFSFTYETNVMAPGEVEIEPWTTFRLGRENFYSRIDQRLEFEVGLTQNLQTSLYWNTTVISQDETDGATGETVRNTEIEPYTVSSEWKYKLSDRLADALGSALYLEGTYGPAEAEVEGKIILDKQIGNVLLAGNLVAEQEWEFSADETEKEQKLELDLAAGYFISPVFLAGVEAFSSNIFEEGELESSTLYAGPALSYASDHYWVTLSVLPQLFAPKSEEGDTLDLDEGEHLRARILLGVHL